jgi:uncharacterized membrane protein YkvA (DUF1232 family)
MKNFFKRNKQQNLQDDIEDPRMERVSEDKVREKVAEVGDEDVEAVMEKEERISEKFINSDLLRRYVKEFKLMMAMIKDYRKGNYKEVPWFTIAAITATALYVLNPIDIIPDFIMGLGFIDDLAVFSITHGWIQSDLKRYENWKLENEGVQEE